MRRHNVSTMTGSIATRSIAAGSIAAGLLMAACGGADESEADASPVGDNGTVDVADGDAPADGAAADDDAPESVDGSAADGDLDAFEESSGEPIPSDGAGIVTIDGVAYTFAATVGCLAQGDDFIAEGLGADPDGNPAWVGINASRVDIDGDGEAGPSIDLWIEPGRTELFGEAPDDAPDFSALYFEGVEDVITYELNDGRIVGSGPISDYNGIAAPLGETLEMTFEASCN